MMMPFAVGAMLLELWLLGKLLVTPKEEVVKQRRVPAKTGVLVTSNH